MRRLAGFFELRRLNTVPVSTGDWPSRTDLIHHAIHQIEAYHQHSCPDGGLPTGFTGLDELIDGLHAGEVMVVSGGAGMGKTSLAMKMAENLAVKLRVPVGIFSLNASGKSLMIRLLTSLAKVNSHGVRSGSLAKEDFAKLITAAGHLSKAPVFIDDPNALCLEKMRTKALRMHLHYGVKLFVIDSFQGLLSSQNAPASRQARIANASRAIKELALDLRVPFIVLNQLPNTIATEKPHKTGLLELGEFAPLQEDADVVCLLERDDGLTLTQPDPISGCLSQEVIGMKLHILKQRNGPLGEIKLMLFKSCLRFEEYPGLATSPSGA